MTTRLPFVRRIIVIDRETTVREAVFFDTDSIREARRKFRTVHQPTTHEVLK